MQSVIAELNSVSLRGHSYTICETKSGRLITQNVEAYVCDHHNIRGVLVSTDQKASGRLEDIFAQVTPREVMRPHKPWFIYTAT